jgi:aryl-alcohol dehydrogenase-like predicted oxidoreductase
VSAGTLGSTGISVTRLGLGLAALGRPGYINVGHGADLAGRTDPHAMEGNAHAVLDAAYAGGIRYFDAARSYGRAEEFLASWLRERSLAPSDVTIGSKWGYTYTAGWRIDAEVHEKKDLSVETLRRQLPETLAHLGPYLRLYQIHSATVESGVLDDQAVLGELDNVRARGIAVGLTVTGPGQRETIERALDLGRFDSVQATWNLLERRAEPALAACHEAGMGVIVKEALANGRLAARGDAPFLVDAARRRRVGPDAVALAVAMAQPWADVVLSGATTADELESNLAASSLEVDDDLLAELEALREDADDYWRTRAALPWN